MKKSDQGMEIIKINNGFSIKDSSGETTVIEASDSDELRAIERLLWTIIEFFGFVGSKHDTERIWVIRRVRDNYKPKKSEKIVRQSYAELVRK